MATIANLEQVAEDFLDAATITDADQAGVELATSGDVSVFTSSTDDVDLTGTEVDHVALTGDADLDVTGDADQNFIVGNDGDNNIDAGAGDDQVNTGAGDDTISLGDGDDTVVITGDGTKTIDGGAGNDVFVINHPAGVGSDSTFTGLNRGDTVRLTVGDSNGDGVLGFDDVEISASDNGSLMFTLGDGTKFTLDGVSEEAALNGEINYEVVDNGNGTWDVVLS